jgi:hypothetical protein
LAETPGTEEWTGHEGDEVREGGRLSTGTRSFGNDVETVSARDRVGGEGRGGGEGPYETTHASIYSGVRGEKLVKEKDRETEKERNMER